MNPRPNDQENAPEGQQSVGVGVLLRGLQRYPLIVFSFFIFGGAAAAAVWFFLPLPKLTAYSIVHIKSQGDYVLRPEQIGDYGNYRGQQAAFLKSRTILNSAVAHPEVGKSAIFTNLEKDGIDPLVWLESNLTVDFKLGNELMRMSLEGNDPDEIKGIVDVLTKNFIKSVDERDKWFKNLRTAKLEKVYRNFEQKLVVQRELIKTLAESLGSGDLQAVRVAEKYRMEMLGSFERDVVSLDRELVHLRSATETVQDDIKKFEEREQVIGPELIGGVLSKDIGYQKLLERQKALEKSIEDTKSTLKEGVTHPLLEAKKKDLALLKQEAEGYYEKMRPAIETQIREGAIAREKQKLEDAGKRIKSMMDLRKALEEQLKIHEAKDIKFKKDHVRLEILRGEIATYERSADRVFQELEALRLEMETSGRVIIWEDPAVKQGIEGNRRLKYSAITGISVFLLGIVLVGFLEMRNRRVVDTSEVTTGLGLRVIGTVPAMPKRALGRANSLSSNRIPDWQLHLAECVDNTRTLLLHGMEGAAPVRTIMITSALSGEGKTSLAGHLAVSMARAGFRTLLIDADMRRPTLHQVLGVPLADGLCEVLRGEASLDDVIRQTPAVGLSVIPAGNWHSIIPRLLAGDAWSGIKARLETEYDYIIVDTPPLLPVADTLLLARHVDGVLLSLLHNVSRLGAVAEAKDRLSTVGTNLLGVIINGVTSKNSYGSAYSSYYYHRPGVESGSRA